MRTCRRSREAGDRAASVGAPVWRAEPREGRDEVDPAVVGERRWELLALRRAFEQAEPVSQPLDRRTGHEDGPFERAPLRLALESRGRGAEHTVSRGLLGLDEDEGTGSVGRLRAPGGEERSLLVARDAFDRQRPAEEVALAEMGAGRPDLWQEVVWHAEELEQVVVPVERLERAEERA